MKKDRKMWKEGRRLTGKSKLENGEAYLFSEQLLCTWF